jgi:hypothetical protein
MWYAIMLSCFLLLFSVYIPGKAMRYTYRTPKQGGTITTDIFLFSIKKSAALPEHFQLQKGAEADESVGV